MFEAIEVLQSEKDKWKRALGRLRKADRRKNIKKEYPIHIDRISKLQAAIKILKESEIDVWT